MPQKLAISLLTVLPLVAASWVRTVASQVASPAPSEQTLLDGARRNNVEQVQRALAAGIPPDSADHNGATPLLLAVAEGAIGTAQVLVRAGANVNASDTRRFTPLMAAAFRGSEPLVEMLLRNGADVFRINRDGATARTLANLMGHAAVEQRLALQISARTPNMEMSAENLALLCHPTAPIHCRVAASKFLAGLGVAKDESRAASLLERACASEDGPGCFYLGVLYRDGRGVARDAERANAAYRRACSFHMGFGCSNLGLAYLMGQGVSRDLERAISLFRLSCDLDGQACIRLAFAYLQGEGVVKDEQKGLKLLERACAFGHSGACAERKKRAV